MTPVRLCLFSCLAVGLAAGESATWKYDDRPTPDGVNHGGVTFDQPGPRRPGYPSFDQPSTLARLVGTGTYHLSLIALATEKELHSGDPSVVEQTPGLVAFWTFGEDPASPRLSRGTKDPHPLATVGPTIPRVEGGAYSGYSAHFLGSHYLEIPYARTGDLNLAGPGARVSMFAVVRLDELKRGSTIAGMWSEGKGAFDDTGTRQYAMLLNMPTYGGPGQLTPHISGLGGHSRRADGSALPWCADYAANRTRLPMGEWITLAFTYDGRWLKAYYNGVLETREVDPQKDKRDDPYFTKEGPDGGHRGINPYFYDKGIFAYDPAKHATSKPGGGANFTVGARYAVGSMLGEALKARIAGLAVFDRALTDEEVARLHRSAGLK